MDKRMDIQTYMMKLMGLKGVSCVIQEFLSVKFSSLCTLTPLSPSRGRPCYVEQPHGRLWFKSQWEVRSTNGREIGGIKQAYHGCLVWMPSEEDGLS